MPHVIQAAAFWGVVKTLTGAWTASKRPGVISRGDDRLWHRGTHSFVPSAFLARKADKVSRNELTVFSLHRQFCLLAFCKCSLGRSSAWLAVARSSADALFCRRKSFSSSLRLIFSKSISTLMRATCSVAVWGCVPGTGTLQ